MQNKLESTFRDSKLEPVLRSIHMNGKWAKRWVLGRSAEPITVTIDGSSASFLPRSPQEYHWITRVEDEEGPILEDLISEVEDGDVFWDIGANIGLVSCLVGNAADIEIVAFEPYPPNIHRLRQNLSDNSLSNRSTVLESALGSEDGTAALNIAVDWDTKHSLVNESGDTVSVPVKRGDSVASERRYPDVVKIDVEGAEMDVISGMEETIDHCRKVHCEVHRLYGVDETAVRDRFERSDFEVTTVAADEKTSSLVATR